MMNRLGKRILCLVLAAVLLMGTMPVSAFAAQENAFILVAEGGGSLVIAPEYVAYEAGQTIRQALAASGHTFTGLEEGVISEINGVVGNYTRSDDAGGYDLDRPASEIRYFRISEASDSKPSDGLKQLMTAMADYRLKEADVQAAAKGAYDMAYSQFLGIDSKSAAVLAEDLNAAVQDYENTQSGTHYEVTFRSSAGTHIDTLIRAENAYGKVWEETADGILELPVGSYTFLISRDGLRVTGTVEVSGNMTVQADLPQELWLDLDAFRLSGSYGPEDSEESKFSDDEFVLEPWTDRQTTAAVTDTFTGTVYTYTKYRTDLLDEVPVLTAVYRNAQTGEATEQNIPFESLRSGAVSVLSRGAEGNQVIYRVSVLMEDGYTYSQDYTVSFGRIPTLSCIRVADQEGVDQAAGFAFAPEVNEYTYKVVDSVTAVTVKAEPLVAGYTVTVNGTEDTGEGVAVDVNGETQIDVTVTAGGYSNTYTLTVLPGEGQKISFITANGDVTMEVVNSNGEVMPYQKFREGTSGNRYQYVLVPGETYSYVATLYTYYHVADEFVMEDVAGSTIQVDLTAEDWLSALAMGVGGQGSKYKDTLKLNETFDPAVHSYETVLIDTEHIPYIWVTGTDKSITIKAIYTQVFSSDLYHGKEKTVTLTSGKNTGEKLQRFLMDENPIENTVTVRLIKEQNGMTYYQDYVVEVKRSLTLEGIEAECDGAIAVLTQADGTTGYNSDVREYTVTVSMAAQNLALMLNTYQNGTCYGEDSVGYRVLVDSVDVTDTGTVDIPLDGTIETQTVSILVENDKAPEGTGEYILHILKSPPVEATFEILPEEALLVLYDKLSGQRLRTDENGVYQLCEGSSYDYVLSRYGYVNKVGVLEVTRDDAECLVVRDGETDYIVEETDGAGGAVTIVWMLDEAPVNEKINPDMEAQWADFRGDSSNNGVTDAPSPVSAEDGTLYWANQVGNGIDSDAVGSPIIVEGDLITYASDRIYRIDTVSGEVLATGTMDHKSSFSITPPTYYEGMVFVALSNGTVQAFNADTLESLWIYQDPLGGQPNSPLTVHNGYLYTGFWNSETGDANFVCLSVTDENPEDAKESKAASWFHTAKGGYYWAGAYATDEYVLVGTDDGTNSCTGQSSGLLMLDARTGDLLDSEEGLNGDIRSTVVFDSVTDACYFASKGGSFYSVRAEKTDEGWNLTNLWSVALNNGGNGTPMSTSTPVVYNGRAYVGVSGAGQFSAYSGHNITVIDLKKKAIAYSVQTQGYPQTSGLLTTAYEEASGYVYIYFFDNMTPGKLRVLRDKAGQTRADYLTTENGESTAYALFTPTGEQAQYAICSPIADEYGTVYFKNDSAYLMAYGSAIEKIEVTTLPDKMVYAEGETFDPAGMVVTATYANGKTRDITDYVTCNADPFSDGNTIVTISFDHVMYHNVEDGSAMNSGVRTATPVTTLTVEIGEPEEPDQPTEPGMDDMLMGDVNGDGEVDVRDANLAVSWYYGNVELDDAQLIAADVTGDGDVDVRDANLIVSYYYGTIEIFPAEQAGE